VVRNELRVAWLADPRIGRDPIFACGHSRGFRGECLPEDVSAIIAAARAAARWLRLAKKPASGKPHRQTPPQQKQENREMRQ
jgi:UDP-glucose 6-dehydrogenase